MTDLSTADFLSVAIPVGTAFIAWIASDARSKARAEAADKELAAVKTENMALAGRVSALEVGLARCEADRSETHRSLDRLDDGKASKDVVDGLGKQIATLRDDMDKRFDRLERLLQSALRPPKTGEFEAVR